MNKLKGQRLKLGMTQTAFWAPVGVTQSGGSRFENDREMPVPISTLLELCHGKTPLNSLAKLRNTTVEELIKAGK